MCLLIVATRVKGNKPPSPPKSKDSLSVHMMRTSNRLATPREGMVVQQLRL